MKSEFSIQNVYIIKRGYLYSEFHPKTYLRSSKINDLSVELWSHCDYLRDQNVRWRCENTFFSFKKDIALFYTNGADKGWGKHDLDLIHSFLYENLFC